jgi:hypothetical protein
MESMDGTECDAAPPGPGRPVAFLTRVEVDRGAGKAEEEGVAAVGVVDAEGGVLHELAHRRQVARHVAARLQSGASMCV